jgi:hypothetical protein
MAEATMSSGGGGGRPERVEGPDAVTLGERGLGGQVLHKKTREVKLNRTRIVGGEPTNRKEIMGDVRGYENIVEIEWYRENRGTY